MSNLYRVIHTLFMTPFYLAGLSSEKQVVELEMYSDFEEDQVYYEYNFIQCSKHCV